MASVTSGTRNWQTIESSLATGSLTGIEGLTLELADLEVKFNTASDSANPAAVVPVIDWTTMVNGGPLSITRADGTDYALTLTGKVTRVAATITELNLFDFVTATDGGIAYESSVADVTGLAGGDLTDATLTRIAITVGTASIGAGGIGISVTGGALYVASITPRDPVADPRHWQTIESSLATGELNGIDGLTLKLADLEVKFNTAANTTIPTAVVPAIDWTSMVNSGPLSITRADGTDYALTLTGKVTRVAATISELNAFDFLTGEGSIAYESTPADVNLDGGAFGGAGDLDDATLTRIAITLTDASVGAGGIGFHVDGGTLYLATLTPAVVGTKKGWTALTGSLSGASFEGIDGLVIEVASLTVQYNQGKDGTPGSVQPPAINWTTQVDLDNDGVKDVVNVTDAAGVDHPITYTQGVLKVTGTGATVDLFGFLVGSVNFEFSTDTVDVDLDGGGLGAGDLDDAGMTTIALSLDEALPTDPETLTLTVGAAGFGVTVRDGTVKVATIGPKKPLPAGVTDTRSWIVVEATNLGASLTLPGVTATVSDVGIKINRASGLLNGTTAASPINWVTGVDVNESGTFTPAAVQIMGGPLTQTGGGFAVDGELADLDILGLMTGSARFALSQDTVDVELAGAGFGSGDLDDATLLTFAISLDEATPEAPETRQLTVGVPGFGVVISDGTVHLAFLKPKAPPTPAGATDNRTWTVVEASNLGATLSLPGITASVSGVGIQVNTASGAYDQDGAAAGFDPISAQPLDWVGSVDADETTANGFTPAPVEVDGVALTLDEGIIAVSGELANLDIFGLLTGAARFALVREVVDVDVNANGVFETGVNKDLNNANLLTIGLSLAGPDRFLRVGTDGFGILIADGDIRIATIAAGAPPVTTPPTEPDPRSWIAVQASGLNASLQLPGGIINASVSDLAVEVNRGSGGALALDWTKAVDTDEAGTFTTTPVLVDGEAITLDEEILAVRGGMHLNIADFVEGDADFSMERTTVSVDLPLLQPDIPTASLMTIGLKNTQLRIGPSDGPHFSVTGGNLALALLKSAPVIPNPADTRSWMALSGAVTGITLAGLPADFVLDVETLGIEINTASGNLAGANLGDPARLDQGLQPRPRRDGRRGRRRHGHGRGDADHAQGRPAARHRHRRGQPVRLRQRPRRLRLRGADRRRRSRRRRRHDRGQRREADDLRPGDPARRRAQHRRRRRRLPRRERHARPRAGQAHHRRRPALLDGAHRLARGRLVHRRRRPDDGDRRARRGDQQGRERRAADRRAGLDEGDRHRRGGRVRQDAGHGADPDGRRPPRRTSPSRTRRRCSGPAASSTSTSSASSPAASASRSRPARWTRRSAPRCSRTRR